MNLKRLHENAVWQKLNEQDFRTKAINQILIQESTIEKLSTMITQLTEDVYAIKRQLNIIGSQNAKLTRNVKSNMQADDESFIKQKRDNRSVS